MQLTNHITITVPGTQGVSSRITKAALSARVNEVIGVLSGMFGGATAVPATGGYMADNGQLVIEPVYNVTAYCTSDSLAANREELARVVDFYRNEWQQEAVAYEIDGVLYV